MATIEWKDAKTIANKYKFLVFGYVKKQYRNDIPDSILFMILLFYYTNEYFDIIGKDVIVSNDKLTITKRGDNNHWNNSTYCTNWMSSTANTITKWLFHIDEIGVTNPEYVFGIVSIDNCQNEDFSFPRSPKDRGKWYTFGNNGSYSSSHGGTKASFSKTNKSFTKGDTIQIVLDLKRKQFIGRINGGSENDMIWNDIECDESIKYKLAIGMFSKGNQVTLLQYN